MASIEDTLADDVESFGVGSVDVPIVLKIRGETRLDTGPFRSIALEKLGEGAGWVYAVFSSADARARLVELLSEYSSTSQDDTGTDWNHPASWATLLDNIADIEIYGASDRRDRELDSLDFAEPQVLDILIWPSETNRQAAARVASVSEVIADSSDRNIILATDPRPEGTLIRARVDADLLQLLLEAPLVERIRPPLRTLLTDAQLVRAQVPDVQNPQGEAIGVVDGVVVTANPLLGKVVLASTQFPRGHTFRVADSHGSRVASIAAYGCLDFVPLSTDPPVASPIVSARVLDVNGSTLEVAGIAHQTIPSAIRWMVNEHAIRVVNVSINRPYAVDSLLRSELCEAIDAIARELNVVVVVPSGNRQVSDEPATGWSDGYPSYLEEPESGVADPGDAALAVTVGSIAARDVPGRTRSEYLTAIAPAGRASPFTRTGPVRSPNKSGILKPEFVHVGGNWATDGGGSPPLVEDPNLGVVVARPPRSGRIVEVSTGTSLAAPAVAREIALIATRYPSASANLLRALAALSGRAPETSRGRDSMRVSAYGQPKADRVLESGGSDAILTIEEVVPTNSVTIHSLPIPYDFARGGSRRSVRVALAFDPPVRRSRREYIAGQMSVQLVRGLSFDDVSSRYQRQPSRLAAEADASLQRLDLPSGRNRPDLEPRSGKLEWNTLIRRDFIHGSWDPDDETYFLVVTHNLSRWTEAQRRRYSEQAYALAVQVVDEERTGLDVHGLILEQLRSQARQRARGRVR